MNKINELQCFTDAVNTGMPDCLENPGLIRGLLLVPHRKVHTRAATAAYVTYLAAQSIVDSRLDRILPVKFFEAVESAGDDRVQQTFGYGRKQTVRRGHIGWNFTMTEGKKQYHTALMGVDGKHGQYDALLVADGENGTTKIIGTSAKDATGQDGIAGFDLSDLFVGDYIMPNGSEGGQWTFGVELADSAQFNSRFASVDVEGDVFSSVVGLQTARLSNETPTGGTANHGIVRVRVNGVNAADVYGAGLAQTGAWVATDNSTGTAVTISAITLNGLGQYDFTFTSGTGKTVTLKMTAPSVLAALTTPVVGIESNTVTIAIP